MRESGTVSLSFDRDELIRGAQVFFFALFAATLALPGVWGAPGVRNSIVVAFGLLVAWRAVLQIRFARGRAAPVAVFLLKKEHYFQILFHGTFFVYWALWWHEAVVHLPLFFVQLAFAYVFDMLLSWTRGKEWFIGFGPIPIVTSLNFFLWVENEYFFAHFLIVAFALSCRHFITWERDGRRRHIFNPSSFPLAVFALILMAGNLLWVTQGADVILSFTLAPHGVLVLFLIGLAVNAVVPTVLITGSAVAATFLANYVTFLITGEHLTPLPYDPNVMLGMTLLVTDPATSPRGNVARAMFGFTYGLLTLVDFWGLSSLRQPGYFDKILAVPVVNLLVPFFERVGGAVEKRLRAFRSLSWGLDARWAHLAAWIAFFVYQAPTAATVRPAVLVVRGIPYTAASSELLALQKWATGECQREPRICAPFGLPDEIIYLMTRTASGPRPH
ncbi:MAG: hypothetical protein HY075_10125 [Deltaproteobacteria bacterium]|nr:hypothetical protein [Deltaproteobacteria bacterium]